MLGDPDPVPDSETEPMRAFDHEKLDVYKVAIDFVASATEFGGDFRWVSEAATRRREASQNGS